MIDINTYNIDKETVLKFLDETEIYEKYLDGQKVDLKKNINSTIAEDSKPSLSFFIGDSGELCFKDFRAGTGDFVKYVQLKFNLNFRDALKKIINDFNISDCFKGVSNIPVKEKSSLSFQKIKEIEYKKIKVKTRNWQIKDLIFWNKFGISKETLEKFKVFPISHYQVNDTIIKADNLAYVFVENKDGIQTYKIYQPKNINFKWISSNNFSIWDGWELLPEKGEKLIITKSRKDVMFVDENCNIPATCLQNEKAKPKKSVLLDLKSRFKTIYLLYDNDFDKETNWGQQEALSLCIEYPFLVNICIPKQYKSKDITDLSMNKGKEFARDFLLDLTLLPF